MKRLRLWASQKSFLLVFARLGHDDRQTVCKCMGQCTLKGSVQGVGVDTGGQKFFNWLLKGSDYFAINSILPSETILP